MIAFIVLNFYLIGCCIVSMFMIWINSESKYEVKFNRKDFLFSISASWLTVIVFSYGIMRTIYIEQKQTKNKI